MLWFTFNMEALFRILFFLFFGIPKHETVILQLLNFNNSFPLLVPLVFHFISSSILDFFCIFFFNFRWTELKFLKNKIIKIAFSIVWEKRRKLWLFFFLFLKVNVGEKWSENVEEVKELAHRPQITTILLKIYKENFLYIFCCLFHKILKFSLAHAET